MKIYLDNAATTIPCKEAITAICDALGNTHGNPSSLHRLGLEAQNAIENTRKMIAATLSCDQSNIVFTSGATESNNLALQGAVKANSRNGKRIVTSGVEHSSVVETLKQLALQGYEVVQIMPNMDGNFNAADFAKAVDASTVLVTCMMVNNEVGTILPIEQIARLVKAKNPKTLVHVDAVQGFCKLPIRLKKLDVDLMSFSGHKVYAPKGVGFLYVKQGTKIAPLIHGGSQEKGLRAGTENIPMIVSLGAAIAAQYPNMAENTAHFQMLNRHMKQKIEMLQDVIIQSPTDAAPHILSISVAGIRSEILLHFLESHDIYVSSGSACKKGAKSHVLTAMGKEPNVIDTTLRISFHTKTTTEELDELLEKIILATQTLIKMK